MNKIVESAAQEKIMKENLIFLIDPAAITMVAKDTKYTENKPITLNKTWNHKENGKRPFKRSWQCKNQQVWRKTLKSLMSFNCT